jgi:hypothetical protein
MVLLLSHWPRLPTPLLPLVPGPLLRHLHWLKERLAGTTDRWMLGQILQRYAALIRDTDRMLGQLGIDALDRTLVRACRSPEHLSILHDALVAEINSVEDVNGVNAALSLGPAPIASEGAFQAITTLGDLHEEGRQMRHCVATRADDILAGACYVYRVELNGERGTLQLGIRPDGVVIDEFRLRDNAEPSPAAWTAAMDWIERARSSKRG